MFDRSPLRFSIRRAVISSFCACAALLTGVKSLSAADPAPDGWLSVRSKVTGLVSFLSGPDRKEIPFPASEDPLAILRAHGALFGLDNPEEQLQLIDQSFCVLGDVHHRYQQMHRGVSVFTGQLIVHQHPDGTFTSVNGDFYPIPPATPIEALFRVEDAIFLAEGAMEIFGATAIQSTLVLVDPRWYGDPPAGIRLAWHLTLEIPNALPEHVLIDAVSGELLDRWPAAHSALFRRVNVGTTGGVGVLAREEGDPATGDTDIDAGYDFAGDVYQLLMEGLGRDSLDGSGGTLRVTAHWSSNICPNAVWNGSRSLFCDGLLTDDVLAHEFFHGVTQFTAGLIYQNQPGMLNESFSDVFGELVDLWNGDASVADTIGGSPSWPATPSGSGTDTPNDSRTDCSDGSVRWRMGEDTSLGAIRDLYFPECFSDPPSTTDPSYANFCDPNVDHGGVHSGSGVPNHAFAMLVDGKTFNGVTVSPIGAVAAGSIWFRTLTVYLTPASFFADADPLFVQAATDLLGTNLNDPRTGAPSGIVMSAADLTQLELALDAVDFDAPVCGMGPPPANDDCVNAQVVGPGLTPFDSTNATESNAPYPSGLCDPGSLGQFAQDVWFQFTPQVDGLVTFSTCNVASFDTDLGVYSGLCGALVAEACNGDTANCSVFTSEIPNFPVTGGVTYFIRIGSWEVLVGWPGELSIDYSPSVEICDNGVDDDGDTFVDCDDSDCITFPACQWPGDECDVALSASLGAQSFDTTGATTSTDAIDPAGCAGSSLGAFVQDVWFEYTPAFTGILTVSTCDTANFDSDLGVYSGSCSSLTQLACSGDAPGCLGGTSLIDLVAIEGVALKIRIGGRSVADFGTGTLSLSLFVPPEDCDNGVDDDFDGSTDCLDPDCQSDPVCICDPLTNFTCAQGFGLVTLLSWENGEPYTSIAVRRDGVFIDSLPGNATTYIDFPGTVGTYQYQLTASCGSLQTSATCTALIEPPIYFSFRAPDTSIEYLAQTGVAVLSIPLTIEEDATSPGYPNPTAGFSMSLVNDASILQPIATEPIGIVGGLNSGIGPDYYVETIEPNGLTLGVIYSFHAVPVTLEFAGPTEVISVSYETDPSTLIGATSPVTTLLSWSSTIGTPPVDNVVVSGGGISFETSQEDGLITLIPVEIELVRGDCNTDGNVDLGDPISNLALLFSNGMTTCYDACDANDDGKSNIGDPIYLLTNLFSQGPNPPAPWDTCGPDPTADALGCESFPSCE